MSRTKDQTLFFFTLTLSVIVSTFCSKHILFEFCFNPQNMKFTLSDDVACGSEITPCNKICKPLVVYRFTGNVITSITTLRT